MTVYFVSMVNGSLLVRAPDPQRVRNYIKDEYGREGSQVLVSIATRANIEEFRKWGGGEIVEL